MMDKKYIKWIVIGVIVLLALIVLLNSFTSVPTGFVGVKTHFGKVQNDVLQEGLNGKIPFIEHIVLIDCKTKKKEVTTESSSKDMQTVKVTIAVNYNVMKDTANQLYREVGTDYENVIISPAINESIKSITAQYTAEELLTKRAEVSAMALEELYNKIGSRGFTITEYNIINLEFSEEFDKAIELKAVKQQEVETAKAELEKQKIQNEKEISVAEKDAKVMELQNSQITDKALQLKALEIKQKMIEKWSGNFPNTMVSDNINGIFNLKD